MKKSKYLIITVVIVLAVTSYNKNLFSWGLFNLFTDIEYSNSGLKKTEAFDPDRDILYLPLIENKNLFESVNDLSICRRKDVRKYIYIYLTKGRKYLIKAIEKSCLYQDIIDEIFAQNPDIPKDLSLLPLLESGFNPNAVSRSKAVGLWQFMKNTSRPLGLKGDKWIDERRDIEKSTKAAIRHLRNLYRNLNSWELALAAYNGGGGHVARSIKKSGFNDLWELRKSGHLRTETNEYVPRFAALLLIYKNQRLFDIKDELITGEKPETENFILKYPVNLKQVSTLAKIPLKTIKIFNPELRKSMTPPYYREYPLRIPTEAKERLALAANKLYKYRFRKTIKHRVKKGECLSKIAGKYKKKHVIL